MNLSFWQTLFLALLQGVTELFPISSLGHTVIIPGLLHWGDLVRDKHFLPLIVALHLGTSIALVIYFWRDWLGVVLTLVDSIKKGEVQTGTDSWVSWLIIIGCIPAGLLGVFLENPLKELFASPIIAATFLFVNGLILFGGEILRRRAETRKSSLPLQQQGASRPLSSLTWKEAVLVGLAQSLALIPGISRSGSTIVAGLGVRLNHEDAARYSFLLGTPLIGAAALLEVPQLFGQSASVLGLVLLGMVVAGIAAFLSTKFLLKYFENGRLYPFAVYCCVAGLFALLFFIFVH
ncbi:undecaprenyl-diphosphate phosphatase [Dictyobacter kobayashii]|uniref:Undecaprenyl-diphosphatase n=1 Tax=Dictyobacter kobayashii TaxID=2014872 RepID=A0A402AGI1_9CHLR|nr:undecaprenyl-diphosphate phosphatase [Dictyobacter kobayashii]GCE18231.1 undecaprenyl-diphosphatase [Dictyobacter kobayashii]